VFSAFGDPAVYAESGAAPGDVQGNLQPADLVTVLVRVSAALGVASLGTRSGWKRAGTPA